MKIHELLIEKKNKADTGSAFSRLSAAARGEDPEFAPKTPEPKVDPVVKPKDTGPINYDIPTAQRKAVAIDQTPPKEKSQGSVYTPSKPKGRQRGDLVDKGQNKLQWTGEPGKEWMIVNGPLLTANPATDRRNRIVSQNGKRYLAAADAKEFYSVESR